MRVGGGGGFPLVGGSEEREGLPCVLYGGGGGASLAPALDDWPGTGGADRDQ